MIDEIRRKKFLESLGGRSPASDSVAPQPSTVDDSADESVSMEDMGIEGLLKKLSGEDSNPVNVAAPKIDRQTQKDNNLEGDMLVGASHALIGLLSGNHNRMAMETSKANKYLGDKAKEDKISAKDLVKVNQEGKPTYIPASEAVDREAYVPPKGSQSRANKYQIKPYENKDNPDDTVNAFIDPNEGVVKDSRTGKPLDLETYIPKGETKNVPVKDQYGTVTNNNISRGGTIRSQAELSAGEGKDPQIPVTKIRTAEKVVSDYQKKASKYQDDLSNISMAKKVLMDKNASPQEKKLAMGQAMKTVEQRMTDADRDEYKGEASVFVNFGNIVDMMRDNEIPPQVERAFIQATNNLERKINATSGLYRKSTVRSFAGGDKKLQDYIEQKLTPPSAIEDTYQPAAPRKSFKQSMVDHRSPGPELKTVVDRRNALQAELQKRAQQNQVNK